MIDLIEILGLCAGFCTTCSFLPQLAKVYRTKSTADISLHMYVIYCLGLSLWTAYGFMIASLSLILANFITLVFAASILCMKLRWEAK